MKIWKMFILIAYLCAIQPQAFAGEPIDGAFGFKLGDVFDPATATKTASEKCWFKIDETTSSERDVPIYFVTAPNAPKVFSRIFLEITPKSRKIYRITAKGNALNKVESDGLEATLRGKYSSISKEAASGSKIVDQGNRYIDFYPTMRPSGYVNVPPSQISVLTYTDENLLKQALKEEAEITFDKKSGL